MNEKCWCGELLATILLRTPWRDAGVQPMLHCPEHGDQDSRASLEARAKKAEADAETAWGIIKRIARLLPEGARPFDLYATAERVAEIVAERDAFKAEVERLKQGYLAAGVNSLSWRFMEAINKLFDPCFEERKT